MESKLRVEVLDFTDNALALIYAACRQCYSAGFAGDIAVESSKDPQKQADFVRQVAAAGHESPLEHVKCTFAIGGVSRALTHQLVRHRLASYSQQSQRYVKASPFEYIVPPSIDTDADMRAMYIETMDRIQDSYDRLTQAFADKGIKGERANQDARYVLPQAAASSIVVTMNCRELIHFFGERCCSRAQWEIRNVADKMLEQCRQRLPAVFEGAGPKCLNLGFCPEGEKFTCGRMPAKQTMKHEC